MPAALMVLLALGAAGDATAALRARDAEIRAALPAGRDPTPDERRRIEAIVVRAVDVPGMARAALGPRWRELREPQRRRLLAAFERRFRAASSAELGAWRSSAIAYLPEEEAGGGQIRVPTRVTGNGERTEIGYRMRRDAAGWRIVDIVVDGVSTVENYRSSFARILSREGADGLIQRLERGAPSPAARSGT